MRHTGRMATAVATPEETLSDRLEDVFYPSNLNSFRESLPSGQLRLILHSGPQPEQSREITLSNMFPFMTLMDVKLALYAEMQEADWALPESIFLCLHGPEPGKDYVGRQVAPLDFTWNLPGLTATAPFRSPNPFKLATADEVDSRFVDSAGERRIVPLIQRERLTLEDAFFKLGLAKGIPVFHAYAYKDVLAAVAGAPSERDWNGRLYQYFPLLETGASATTVDANSRTAAKRLLTIFQRRQQFMSRLESILDENTPLVNLSLAAVKRLQLTWPETKTIPGIETYFYEAAVNGALPFLRFLPAEGSGISKVYLKDGKTPDIDDAKLLVQWAQERNPVPERDFAFGKILLRKGFLNVPPLYSTLRLFDDGSADAIVEPPRGVKKLEPRSDLKGLGETITEVLKLFPYLQRLPDIGSADVVLGLRLPKGGDTVALSPRTLRQRLPIFSGMFQEISPLPGESPLVMLRYKLVSNFAREDRIHTFITQVINRRVVKGELLLASLPELVADEFQLDLEEARRRVAQKLQNQADVMLTVPETKDYRRTYVEGTDVAIFAQHPFYTFHLYKVTSLETLRRVVTGLSILMSAPLEQLQIGAKAVKELNAAEAAAGAAASVVPEPEAVAAAAAEPEAAAPEPEPEQPITEDAAVAGDAEDLPEYLDYFAFEAQTNANANVATAVEREGAAFPEPPLPQEDGLLPSTEEQQEGPLRSVAQLERALSEEKEAPREELAGTAAAAAAAAVAPPENGANNNANTSTAAPGSIASYFLTKLKEADPRLFGYGKKHASLKRYVSGCSPTYGRQPAVLSEEKFRAMEEEYAKDDVVFHIYPLMPGEPEKPAGEVEKEFYSVLRYGSSPGVQNYYLCSRYFCVRDEILVREADLESRRMRRPIRAADGSLEYPPKNPGECPFCRGKVIKNQRAPGPNETILERATARLSTKRHLYIRFLKKVPHPEGFSLPCCFLDMEPIRFRDSPAFEKARSWGVPPKPGAAFETGPAAAAALALTGDEEEAAEAAAAAAAAAAEEGQPAPETPARAADGGPPLVSYSVTLAAVGKKYIVGAEKLPLEIGIVAGLRGEPQVGLLPPALDKYFDQDPTALVSRAFNPQKIKPGGMGFLRVAAENRLRFQNDSFLAALAPYFLKENAEQMKEFLKTEITAREFLSLNYGNLLLEFYNPAELMSRFPERRLLVNAASEWAENELDITLQEENEEALVRAYLSYTAFQAWLSSSNTKKEYRQFALLLAQKGVLRKAPRPGITLIILDILKSGAVQVRCPPYGFNPEIMSRNDVGFLMHHWSGIWEPIVYVDNRTIEEGGLDPYRFLFQGSASASWPAIVKRRVQEYMTQCSGPSRAVYTSQTQTALKDGKSLAASMIPVSLIQRLSLKDPRISIEGIVRDAYNHLAAVLIRVKGKEGGFIPGLFPLPVADDGEVLQGKRIMMDWDDPDFDRTPIDRVLLFYKEIVEPRFELYPGYSPYRIVQDKSRGGQIVAVQLRNGLYVPVAPPSSEEAAKRIADAPAVLVDEMEWSINHQIALEEKDIPMPGEEGRLEALEFQEVFERLRVTFANWLAMKEGGGEFRKTLEKIIFEDAQRLPLFERRKRLQILLAPVIRDWITSDSADEDEEAAGAGAGAGAKKVGVSSLLRVDCRIRGQAQCDGHCVWKGSGEGGKCMLHVPETVAMGLEPLEQGQKERSERRVSAATVLLYRLIEELLRYGERRRQLLENDVSRLAVLDKPVTLDIPGTLVAKQRIYPENSQAWYDLLRLDWAKVRDEEPKFLEEMATAAAASPAAAPTAAPTPAPPPTESNALPPLEPGTVLPPTLETILKGPDAAGVLDPKIGALRLARFTDLTRLILSIGHIPEKLGVTASTKALTDGQIRELVRMMSCTFVQLDLVEGTIKSAKPFRVIYPAIPVVVITEEGPALLVKDPAAPKFLQEADLPQGLLQIVKKTKAFRAGPGGEELPGAAAVAAAPAVPTMTLADRRRELAAAKTRGAQIAAAVNTATAP